MENQEKIIISLLNEKIYLDIVEKLKEINNLLVKGNSYLDHLELYGERIMEEYYELAADLIHNWGEINDKLEKEILDNINKISYRRIQIKFEIENSHDFKSEYVKELISMREKTVLNKFKLKRIEKDIKKSLNDFKDFIEIIEE